MFSIVGFFVIAILAIRGAFAFWHDYKIQKREERM